MTFASLDAGGDIAARTSFANGGQLSYSYVAPLADPSVWGQLPKLLTDPASPVQFRPGFDPFQYRWLMAFLAACNGRQATRTIDRLGALVGIEQVGSAASDPLRRSPLTGHKPESSSSIRAKRALLSPRTRRTPGCLGYGQAGRYGRKSAWTLEPALPRSRTASWAGCSRLAMKRAMRISFPGGSKNCSSPMAASSSRCHGPCACARG